VDLQVFIPDIIYESSLIVFLLGYFVIIHRPSYVQVFGIETRNR